MSSADQSLFTLFNGRDADSVEILAASQAALPSVMRSTMSWVIQMTYKLILELPERVYDDVRAAAEELDQTPSEWIITSLQRLLQERERESHDSADKPLSPLYALHENALGTNIPDLATQHDHYLYGSPKRDG